MYRPVLDRMGRLSAVVLCIAAAACLRAPDPGVSIQDVQSNVAFGAAPANAAPQATQTVGDAIDPADFAFESTKLRRLPPTTRRIAACPEAPLSASAAEDAGIHVRGTPKEGIYRWKREGTQELRAPYQVKFAVSGTENRLVQNVKKINADDFTYELAQSEIFTADVVVTTFKVRPNTRSERVGFTDRRVGDPDRGLSIAKIERFDGNTGQLRQTFNPEPDVLILPLPVLAGERFQAVGVAPQSGSLQVEGRVVERRRVDACGELVDGWFVDATRNFATSEGGGTPHEWDFVIGTQLGAMLIQEKIVYSDPNIAFDILFSLGQINPSPPRSGDS